MDAICSISMFLWSNLALGLLIIIFLGLQNSFYNENSYSASVFVRTDKTGPLHAFNAIRHNWQHTCESQNVVLPRGDNIAIDMSLERQWSLHGDTFQEGEKRSATTACHSMESLLAAIKYGERQWKEQEKPSKEPRSVNVSTSYENLPSYFVPRECHISYLSAQESCNILNIYSTVLVAGDSLGRHMAQGLMMILSEDFVTGSYPRGTGLSRDMYDHCRCDGQFSENASCRSFDVLHLLPGDPRDYGLCTHIKGPVFKLQYAPLTAPEEAETSPIWQSLCVRDNRPILLVLNAGAHYGSDPDLTLSQFIHVVHQKLLEANAACEWDLAFKILWTGLNAQSRQLDVLYPHQSRENAAVFNHIVEANIPPSYEMITLDFWNLTRDAATSDGYHYLSDVNVYKATAIVHAASLFHAVPSP